LNDDANSNSQTIGPSLQHAEMNQTIVTALGLRLVNSSLNAALPTNLVSTTIHNNNNNRW